MASAKPRVLVLGGCGFIGRHLIKLLVDSDFASKIRVADKQLPQTVYLTEEFEAAFAKVEYKQANLSNPAHVTRAFDDPEGKWNIVVNLAAETKYGQDDGVYKQMIVDIAEKCSAEAAKREVDLWIEVSTAQVYDADKKASKESDKLKPWTTMAKFKLEAEEAVKKNAGLKWVILRPALVYGPADVNGLMPRVICAATYAVTKEKMQFLWSSDLRFNTVHVTDVVRAIVHVAKHGTPGSVYNLADKGDTNQKAVAEILERMFGIKTDFLGTVASQFAKLNMGAVVEAANDNHMAPWSELTKEHGIKNSPLSPYIDQELLYNTPLSVDGSAIETTGFRYEVPAITEAAVRDSVGYYISKGLFPNILK